MDPITKDIIIGDLLERHPEAASILFRSGMHCVGCSSAQGETLEEAGTIHGIDVDKMVDEINGFINQ